VEAISSLFARVAFWQRHMETPWKLDTPPGGPMASFVAPPSTIADSDGYSGRIFAMDAARTNQEDWGCVTQID